MILGKLKLIESRRKSIGVLSVGSIDKLIQATLVVDKKLIFL
jgi:hypothetical protein